MIIEVPVCGPQAHLTPPIRAIQSRPSSTTVVLSKTAHYERDYTREFRPVFKQQRYCK